MFQSSLNMLLKNSTIQYYNNTTIHCYWTPYTKALQVSGCNKNDAVNKQEI